MSEIEESNTVKTLRERGDKAEAEAKRLAAELKTLKGQVRQSTFAPILKQRGVPEKVASLIPDDVETADAVTSWLDDFGFKAPEAAPQAQTAEPTPQVSQSIDPSIAAQLGAIQRVEAGAIPDTAVGFEKQLAAIQSVKDDPNMNWDRLVSLYDAGKLPF